ncbi:hypothetical protein H112_08862 [Trichophyton rubrum D6]|uniref:Dolichyl-diphosphooligosaccharide--protein glycosyltransferase subunit 4 n=2 Tax=Trichophyton TaxID=5550 RepID=A0A022VNG1_TRIRU|nr:hypothetical protein H100_08883 [Trichophyton rubrum MR850]EZF36701.1 hypothetical protein H102_08844 [Trichophyton rubrum CBS 100081]EZF47293.1 hypothetical protein H103_08866 [Trichophyton rubrum CBS 288.86]EZF58031.1 hypothetical protein H104_08814 [Trichophyton rubrum CBS 289.86]EZF68536.1 hypothetical protein H105_08869 [Trichophyton soudanense CBS 452.61]EZF79249.1 hypothetical protein H110_08867 [Trichophyton rubrum MR1448]EZF89848.1 hypothetical protein H113_08933 [Trichophyton rub
MITDNELYQLAIFLGSCAMLLIVVYHFLEVNSKASSDIDSTRVSSTTESTKPSGLTQGARDMGNSDTGVPGRRS